MNNKEKIELYATQIHELAELIEECIIENNDYEEGIARLIDLQHMCCDLDNLLDDNAD